MKNKFAILAAVMSPLGLDITKLVGSNPLHYHSYRTRDLRPPQLVASLKEKAEAKRQRRMTRNIVNAKRQALYAIPSGNP